MSSSSSRNPLSNISYTLENSIGFESNEDFVDFESFIAGSKITPNGVACLLAGGLEHLHGLVPGNIRVLNNFLACSGEEQFEWNESITVNYETRDNEVLLVMGTPDELYIINGDVKVKTLFVFGCNLIINGDVTATDHIYAYCRSLKVNTVAGGMDVIYASLFDNLSYSTNSKFSVLSVGSDKKARIDCCDSDSFGELIKWMLMRGWIQFPLTEGQMAELNEKEEKEGKLISDSDIADICKAATMPSIFKIASVLGKSGDVSASNNAASIEPLLERYGVSLDLDSSMTKENLLTWLRQLIRPTNTSVSIDFLTCSCFNAGVNLDKSPLEIKDDNMSRMYLGSQLYKVLKDNPNTAIEALLDACEMCGIKYTRCGC